MFSTTLSEQEQRNLAEMMTLFLSTYKHISDSYIIEFFSENLWETLPMSWQKALDHLTPPQVSELLLDEDVRNRIYPTVWPLSLLALRTTAHTLAFPRSPSGHQAEDTVTPEEFVSNSSQSSLLAHIFRRHVKPKKQHEVRKLGMLVNQICEKVQCRSVVDVGSGQGHLTRFLSYGLSLNVTGIEADPNLVSMASRFDGQLMLTLAKASKKSGTSLLSQKPLGPAPKHVAGWVNPKDSWENFLQQLGKVKKENERCPRTKRPCKKRMRVSVSSEQERESENEFDYASQPLCEEQCKTEADAREEAKMALFQQHDGELCDSTAQRSSGTAELHNQTSLNSYKLCKQDNGDSTNESSTDAMTSIGDKVLSGIQSEDCSGSDFVLTGLHACGDLSATLLRHFVNCPHVRGITSVACCYMKITTKENPTPPGVVIAPILDNSKKASHFEYGYPMSEWVRGLPGHKLSYKAREGSCHAIEDYVHRLREESSQLKTHCYRAALETIIRAERPELRRAGIQTIKKSHTLSFAEYARLGLPRVGLPADLPFDPARVEDMLQQQGRVVMYFSLALLLAPAVETLLLLDRMLFLQERGFQSQLVPLFDPNLSPRNFVLVSVKPKANGEESHYKN